MKMFKTSVRGFKKSDVNNYIIELNRDFSDTKVNLELQIMDLKENLNRAEQRLEESKINEKRLEATLAELETTKADNSKLQDELDSLNASLSATKEKNSELCEKLTAVEAERDDLSLQLSQKDETIKKLESELAGARDTVTSCGIKVSDLEGSLNEALSRLSSTEEDLTEATVRNCELEALLKKVTEKLVAYESESATNAEREIITKKARKADSALINAASNVTSTVNGAVIESAESCLKEFQQFADKVQFTSKNAISELADEYSMLASRAAYYCDVLDLSTKKTLSEFRGKAKAICNDLRQDS